MKHILFIKCLILTALGIVLITCSQIPLDIGGTIQDIGKIFKKKELPITTSLSDAATEVPFLDDFNPTTLNSMTLLPRTPEGGFLMPPGLFEFEAQSYCLKAGKYGPGKKDGYLYAPWKGSQADVVRGILERSYKFPEISQEDVQVLLWAVIAQTKISDVSDDIKVTAEKLLTPEEISSLDGGAESSLSEDLKREVIDNLPPIVGKVIETEAKLRNMFMIAGAAYDVIEAVAVLEGDPPEGEGSLSLPDMRWSFHPDGYFVRYFPDGYQQTRIQLSVPEPISTVRDNLGRIKSIADDYGNSIEVDYADDVKPATIQGEEGLRGYVFDSIRFSSPEPFKQGKMLKADWKTTGWTLAGDPSGDGQVETSSKPFDDLKERYEWAKEHKAELANLSEHSKNKGTVNEIVDVGNLAYALKKIIPKNLEDENDWRVNHLDLVKKAWQYAVYTRLAESSSGESTRAPDSKKSFLQQRDSDGISSQGPSFNRESLDKQGIIVSPKIGSLSLKKFNPSAGGAQPGNTWRQRIAPSGKKSGDSKADFQFKKTQKAVGDLSDASTVIDLVTYIPKVPLDTSPTLIPGIVAGEMVGMIVELWGDCINALGLDPPRYDYDVIARPEKLISVPLKPGEGQSAAQVSAANAYIEASLDLASKLRAAVVSLDRYGGSIEDNDMTWATRQGSALLHNQRESGKAMLAVSDKLDAYIKVLKNEGAKDFKILPEHIRAYQERLQSSGFSEEELKAAREIKLTGAEMERIMQRRIAINPEEFSGSIFEKMEEASLNLRELGKILFSLPRTELYEDEKKSR